MRKKGIRFLSDVELYEKLEKKRSSNKIASDFDWGKLKEQKSNFKGPQSNGRKKASALRIIGN